MEISSKSRKETRMEKNLARFTMENCTTGALSISQMETSSLEYLRMADLMGTAKCSTNIQLVLHWRALNSNWLNTQGISEQANEREWARWSGVMEQSLRESGSTT